MQSVGSYGQTFGGAYKLLLESILVHGETCAPRGRMIRENIAVTFIVENLRANVLVSEIRDLNYRFMIAEWMWIAGGLCELGLLLPYNSKYKDYSDDGVTLAGAYGPRLAPQWRPLIQKLKDDPDTRQAVVSIWTPNPPPSKDIPCTLAAQFLLRDGRLHAIWTMRSSDAWLGLPYDFFTFSQLTNMVAGHLGVDTGSLTIQIGSSHLYEQDWTPAAHLVGAPDPKTIVSPRLPVYWPDASAIRMTMEGQMVLFPEAPWAQYDFALHANGKKQALVLLQELEAKTHGTTV